MFRVRWLLFLVLNVCLLGVVEAKTYVGRRQGAALMCMWLWFTLSMSLMTLLLVTFTRVVVLVPTRMVLRLDLVLVVFRVVSSCEARDLKGWPLSTR